MTELPDRLTAALADRYRIERELGHGGMATVYLAEDLRHRRRVAIKVIRPELSAMLGGERFLNRLSDRQLAESRLQPAATEYPRPSIPRSRLSDRQLAESRLQPAATEYPRPSISHRRLSDRRLAESRL